MDQTIVKRSEDKRPDRRNFFNNALQRLASWRQYLPLGARQTVPRFAQQDAKELMQACLDEIGGEVAARSRAAELGYLYLNLTRQEKIAFLELLAGEFDIDGDCLARASQEYLEQASVDTYLTLKEAAQPTRIEILKRLNSLPDGFKFLVDLRADLLSFLDDAPSLASLDKDLQGLFEGWFDIGLLTFEQITWDSPASTLERLVEYEAVHRIRSWQDLKNRLDINRRCYAFFHPKIPGDPLIFVEVALTAGIPSEIDALLGDAAPPAESKAVDTAVFYSITNTQKGLRGVSFGSFLLKRVMEDLTLQMPHLRRFVTLSPIPGFRRWAQKVYDLHGDELLRPAELESLRTMLAERGEVVDIARLFESPDQLGDPEILECINDSLLDLCSYYLLIERRDGKPLDPVGRFHITNGASVEQLNFLGDRSPEGMRNSFGMMVNYLYTPEKLERNHEMFFRKAEVAAAADIKRRAAQRTALSLVQGE